MTEPKDWLDEVLDRHQADPAPPGFKIRLMSRIMAQSRIPSRILPFRLPLLLTAALLILATGYWMGMGAPALSGETEVGTGGDTALLELEELYSNRDLLTAWDLLQDPELELGFDASVAGAWSYGQEPAAGEAPR